MAGFSAMEMNGDLFCPWAIAESLMQFRGEVAPSMELPGVEPLCRGLLCVFGLLFPGHCLGEYG